MLEKIVELLLGLAVAAAASLGIQTAVGSPQGPAVDPDHEAERVTWAQERAQHHLAAADLEAQGAENAAAGLDTAIEAIEAAMDRAPDAADVGLEQSWTSVSGAPVGGPEDAGGAADASDAAPVGAPAGPPAEVPAGAPDGVPTAPAGAP